MDKKNKMNSIIERWKADVESYRNGALVEICVPQCETQQSTYAILVATRHLSSEILAIPFEFSLPL